MGSVAAWKCSHIGTCPASGAGDVLGLLHTREMAPLLLFPFLCSSQCHHLGISPSEHPRWGNVGHGASPTLLQMLVARCPWAGESSRHEVWGRRGGGSAPSHLRNTSILIEGISSDVLECSFLLWFPAAFQAAWLRAAVVCPSLRQSPWA